MTGLVRFAGFFLQPKSCTPNPVNPAILSKNRRDNEKHVIGCILIRPTVWTPLNLDDPTKHGLEMQVLYAGASSATTWSDVRMDDIDGAQGSKGTNDINSNDPHYLIGDIAGSASSSDPVTKGWSSPNTIIPNHYTVYFFR